ncbi:TrbC/VirB2 family protein [Xanthomonas euvesicatoria pv. allii]|uniref:TrbC/VirB2 family protein n=1 Tax=Xanthomonas euvesicatoria TaxID=456327 RepID=UPI002404A65C|nr:TrbC/VirB2 family protein [Xanthomonas euvesicatoria]MCP3050734.1 TrbC/VirB2 family protein [Xanthomonas euvesicatoria pv. allii]
MKKIAIKFGKQQRLFLILLVAGLALLAAGPAAAAGISKVNETLELISAACKAVGIPLATIGLMWGGYKMLYQGVSFSEIAPKFLGMVLSGAAGTIAGFVMA